MQRIIVKDHIEAAKLAGYLYARIGRHSNRFFSNDPAHAAYEEGSQLGEKEGLFPLGHNLDIEFWSGARCTLTTSDIEIGDKVAIISPNSGLLGTFALDSPTLYLGELQKLEGCSEGQFLHKERIHELRFASIKGISYSYNAGLMLRCID